MKVVELVRWGLPLAVFVVFFKVSGAGVSLLFAGGLFALISAAMSWHKRDPRAFHIGVRAWIVVLLIVPAIFGVVATGLGFPPALILSVPVLLFTIWVYKLNAKKIEHHRATIGRSHFS